MKNDEEPKIRGTRHMKISKGKQADIHFILNTV